MCRFAQRPEETRTREDRNGIRDQKPDPEEGRSGNHEREREEDITADGRPAAL
jgi:hypothetical protein